MRCTK